MPILFEFSASPALDGFVRFQGVLLSGMFLCFAGLEEGRARDLLRT